MKNIVSRRKFLKVAGFGAGVNGKGRRYSSMSVPGTGLRYSKTHSAKKKKEAVDKAAEEE